MRRAKPAVPDYIAAVAKHGSLNGEPSNAAQPGLTCCMLRMRDLIRITTLSRSVLARLIRAGLFPPGCRKGREHPRWLSTIVDAWLQSRMDARDDMRRLAGPVQLPPWGPLQAQLVPSESGIQMLRICDVAERVGYGKTEIYRRISQGAFPAPAPLAEGRRAWVQHEVERGSRTAPTRITTTGRMKTRPRQERIRRRQ